MKKTYIRYQKIDHDNFKRFCLQYLEKLDSFEKLLVMGEPPQPVVERKKRGRPKKLVCPLSVEEEPGELSGTKKMGRPRKVVT